MNNSCCPSYCWVYDYRYLRAVSLGYQRPATVLVLGMWVYLTLRYDISQVLYN